MGYGQHQSFYLRDRWLNKAIRHLEIDERFFYDKEAFEKIGLGKNMVQSLRYWVVATGVVSEEFNDERKKVHRITEVGRLISKFDRFVKFQDTAAILHYQMVKDKEPSTAWYWYFNDFNETIITKDNLLDELISWVKKNENKPVSERSLKRDIDCLVRLYSAGQSASDPEEVIQSPLNKIGLIEENKSVVYKRSASVEDIGLSALMYVLLDYRENHDMNDISVDDLVNQKGLWGKVFNMKRSSIVNALNEMTQNPTYNLTFIRTNNLDLIRIPDTPSITFLHQEYSRKVGE
ncbi:DUF4007 family protein [Priestia endophytica]|uniref:DUF4007 family protein n=1 Tax=Priestia endophytica TaxID=135735 RepID=UPI002E1EDE3A|nr:DUF4007 family protein [Priestia endophytica]